MFGPERRGGPGAGSERLQDAGRERIAQPVRRRPVGVERGDVGRRARETGRRAAIGRRVEEGQAVAAAHDGLRRRLIGEADARAEVVQVLRVERAVGERQAAVQLLRQPGGRAGRADERESRSESKPAVDLVGRFGQRRLVVPAQAGVQGQAVRDAPVLLDEQRRCSCCASRRSGSAGRWSTPCSRAGTRRTRCRRPRPSGWRRWAAAT